MKTFQDLERGSSVKVRYPRSSITAVAVVQELPQNTSSPLLVKLGGKGYRFDAADVILPEDSFPAPLDLANVNLATTYYVAMDDGTVISGLLDSYPQNGLDGDVLFVPAGSDDVIRVPAYRVQLTESADPAEENPPANSLSYQGVVLTYQGVILTYGV